MNAFRKLLKQAAKDFGLEKWKLYARPLPITDDEHVMGRAVVEPQFKRAVIHFRPSGPVHLASDGLYYPGVMPEEVVYHEALHVVASDCGFARCFDAVLASLRGADLPAAATALEDAYEVLLSRVATAMVRKGKHV